MEKEIRSVANVTRADIDELQELAARIPLQPRIEVYPLAEADRAVADLKAGRILGGEGPGRVVTPPSGTAASRWSLLHVSRNVPSIRQVLRPA